mmetsp:Transcript_29060/g.74749  ORF Transcript_29060/g.74749 Transcript_29060/m.74749 type:complete len:185 (-) Transcript_29060:4734-5288(-)
MSHNCQRAGSRWMRYTHLTRYDAHSLTTPFTHASGTLCHTHSAHLSALYRVPFCLEHSALCVLAMSGIHVRCRDSPRRAGAWRCPLNTYAPSRHTTTLSDWARVLACGGLAKQPVDTLTAHSAPWPRPTSSLAWIPSLVVKAALHAPSTCLSSPSGKSGLRCRVAPVLLTSRCIDARGVLRAPV